MKRLRRAALALIVAATALWLGNTSLFVAPDAGAITLLAHRGLGQDFDREGLTATTCTAARMRPPEHPYLENTLASMRAAFDYGADIVEFDVHPTTDGRFAVFHDWTVDCRTDGRGVTREHSLAQLKMLDIGHGYTADDGRTFPFRGRGAGQMPSLDEVLEQFPDKSFLIHIKSNDPEEGRLLSARLKRLPVAQLSRLAVYGGTPPVAVVRGELPGVRTMSGSSLAGCVLRYAGLGWSGFTPSDCRRSLLRVPVNIAPWLWGWPHRLVRRMAADDTLVFMEDEYTGGGFGTGLNRVADLDRVPAKYAGGIWTDRIDLIGPAIRQRRQASR